MERSVCLLGEKQVNGPPKEGCTHLLTSCLCYVESEVPGPLNTGLGQPRRASFIHRPLILGLIHVFLIGSLPITSPTCSKTGVPTFLPCSESPSLLYLPDVKAVWGAWHVEGRNSVFSCLGHTLVKRNQASGNKNSSSDLSTRKVHLLLFADG